MENNHPCKCPHKWFEPKETLQTMEFERGLWGAAHSGDEERVKQLLMAGANPDGRDSAGYVALHYASRNNHLNICKLLIEAGADVNAVTRAGRATSLQRAFNQGNVKIVELLLENGADIMIKDADGNSVFSLYESMVHSSYFKFRYMDPHAVMPL